LSYAIDLAAVLDDVELRRILEGIATFQEDVLVRGVTDPQLVQKIQERAAERLAGHSALPRPKY
jgi:TfoX/Sxy family transcriptional regulator of competence genes